MLSEISFTELIKNIEEPVYIIRGVEIVTLEDLFEGTRILIDRPENAGRKTESCIETFDENHEISGHSKATSEEVQNRKGYKRKYKSNAEQEILRAWNGGERSIDEIEEITGRSRKTIRKYIPISADD